jgi:hypothetical protein
MNIAVTYDVIHLWRGNVEKVGISARIAAFFSFLWFEKWVARREIKKIQKTFQNLKQLHELILADSSALEGITTRESEEFSEIVNLLTNLHDVYESVSFFNSDQLKSLISKTLQTSYFIEGEFRSNAFKGKKPAKTDEEFKRGLSATSQNAIGGRL